MQTTLTPLGSALTDATRRAFSIGFGTERMGGRQLFDVKETDKRVEVFNSGVMDQFAHDSGDGENYYENESTYGDQLTMTQAKFTSSVEVTQGVVNYDQYAVVEVLEGAEGLGINHSNRIEMDVQQFIKNGATGSYTTIDGDTTVVQSADGVSLFSNLHTVNGSSANYDNLDSVAYGQTGQETLENLFRNFLNHDGQRANRVANTTFSTSEASLVSLIEEYRVSRGHVEDAARGTNTRRGKYSHIVMEYLDTDTSGSPDSDAYNYWGIGVRGGKNLKLRTSQNPMIHEPRVTERSRNLLMQSDDWHSVGVEDAVDIALSQA